MIHVVVVLQNQGAWLLDMLETLQWVLQKAQDDRVALVLVDYLSTDLDVRRALHHSGLPRTTYIAAEGAFSKAEGLALGAASVTNPSDIVFTFDLHITIPLDLFERVRQGTIRGRTGFNPIVARLDCGAFPSEPRGFWELYGYGLLSVYKADFDETQGYKGLEGMTEWGKEDTYRASRMLSHGYECTRERVRGFFHCKSPTCRSAAYI